MSIYDHEWRELEKQAKHEYPEHLKRKVKEARKFLETRNKEKLFTEVITFQKYFISKEIVELAKKANYYEFFIVKKPFYLQVGKNKIYFDVNQEVREPKIRSQIRNYFKLNGIKLSDKIRVIKAPNKPNRLVQYHFYQILLLMVEFGYFKISDSAHGFMLERNAKTGALQHVKFHTEQQSNTISAQSENCMGIKEAQPKLYSYNFDIEDFFPTITSPKLFKFIKRLINARIAKLLCNILTIDSKLVQGSILSPIITNLYLYNFDEQIKHKAETVGICYTRYADDITISSNTEIPKKFIDEIYASLRVKDFKIKSSKTENHINIIWCTGLFVKWINKNCTNTINGKPIKCTNTIYKNWKYNWVMEIRLKRSVFKRAKKTIETMNRISLHTLKCNTIEDALRNYTKEERDNKLSEVRHGYYSEETGYIDTRPRSRRTGKTRYNLAKGYLAYLYYGTSWLSNKRANKTKIPEAFKLLGLRGRTLLSIDKNLILL